MKVIIFFLLFYNYSFASNISFDGGQTKSIFNRFSIPKSTANTVTTSSDDSINNYRVTGYIDLKSKNQFYFLFAPLEISYEYTPKDSLIFNNTTFNSNEVTDVGYKFNSYRVGYLWTWTYSRLRYWLGAVAKIRDAKIEVSQANKSDSYSNVGLVPLGSIGFEWIIFSNISLFNHTDALGSSRGSAYDSQIEIKYKLNSLYASFGKRILGGGADNERVYNFAQFDTLYLRLGLYF